MNTTTRLTLSQAIALPQEQWDGQGWCPGLQVQDLDLTNDDRRNAAALWQWLCDLHPSSKAAAEVGNEVLTDGALMVALALPAIEFVRWFRLESWETFDSTERTGSEAWAHVALQRAWGACEALGELASQRPLAVPQGWAAADK